MKERAEYWLLRHRKLALLFVLGVALAARAAGMHSRPIWYDEAFAILFAGKGPQAMLEGTLAPTSTGASDVHPLGYYTLLWTWMRLFGDSIESVRSLSIAASLATIIVAYSLVFDLLGFRSAVAAALTLALMPFQVHYGQEIRMYAFLGLWLALATLCYWRARQTSRWEWWCGFAVFAAAAQYTHNLAAFYLISLALWPLLTRDWRILPKFAVSAAGALLLYLPWLIHLPAQFTKVDLAYWVQRPAPYRLLTLGLTYITSLPLAPWELAVGMFATLSIMGMALVQTAHGIREADPSLPRVAWILFLAFCPPLLMWLFSQWKPVYLERALLPSGTAFAIWLAWSLMQNRFHSLARLLTLLLVAVGFSIGLHQHLTYRGFPYAPYDAIVADFRSRLRPKDIIVHSSKLSFFPMVYLDAGLPETFVADPSGSGVDTLAPSTQRVLGLEASTDLPQATDGAGRVWFVIFAKSNQEYLQAGWQMHPHLAWLLLHYTLVEVEHWNELDVYLFAPSV